MNKVYFFQAGDGDYGGVYVAAKTWKEARNLAICDEVIADHVDNPITEVSGHVCKDTYVGKGKRNTIQTELSGILTIQQICDVGCAWWECEECNGSDFEITDLESRYKCRDCGFSDNIPYVNF